LQTQYRIWLPTFYIARTPVTLAQCSAFAAATGCRTEAEERGAGEVLLAAGAVVGRGVSWRGIPQAGAAMRRTSRITLSSV
jgi:formylglycine-generating enzyme required for sulfatase activity